MVVILAWFYGSVVSVTGVYVSVSVSVVVVAGVYVSVSVVAVAGVYFFVVVVAKVVKISWLCLTGWSKATRSDL